MGKLHLKKPRIITKHFPEVESHIDRVNSSLETLVFSYNEQVEKALQKKHLMMALSTIVLVIVVGNFIAPKGKADIAVFYPETCLGGWTNPRLAEKEPQTTSNADIDQFNDKNSAILYKNTQADIYCGNFHGEFNDATTPKKILVSFAMTNKEEITEGKESELLTEISNASSSDILLATSTPLVATSTDSATSTVVELASSSPSLATTTEPSPSTLQAPSFVDIVINGVSKTIDQMFNVSIPTNTETDTVVVPVAPQTSPSESSQASPQEEESSPLPGEVSQPLPPETQPQEVTPSVENTPTSYKPGALFDLIAMVVPKVFAQEAEAASPQVEETTPSPQEEVSQETGEQVEPSSQIQESSLSLVEGEREANAEVSSTTVSSSTEETNVSSSTSLVTGSTTSDGLASSSLQYASSSEFFDISSSTLLASTHVDQASSTQNTFLEILYTFDGVTWVSLGELNEISMKYRTFEIPLSASSTWSDMSQLQIKIATKSLDRETPYVYLDAIKVEVLYEGEIEYSHPDFSRDTILSDETSQGLRIVKLINHENGEEEIWYMYLEESETSTSSSLVHASSSIDSASTTSLETGSSSLPLENSLLALSQATSSLDEGATTLISATSTENDKVEVSTTSSSSSIFIMPVLQKNKWYKLEKKERVEGLQGEDLARAILAIDKEELEQEIKEDRLPDFAKDIIKKIKGTFLNAVIIQIEKDGIEELWLYDITTGVQQKIEASTSSPVSFAKDIEVGVKDSVLYFVSEDKKSIYGHDIINKVTIKKEMPSYDFSLGERARIYFEEFGWTVIVNDKQILFYREDTGEVFSDDNGALGEALRQKLELDKLLDKEEISNLSLPVTDIENIQQ